MSKLIDQIDLPAGLRTLGIPELEQVTAELRDELIDTVAASGGHFASSLGAAEISVALHAVFNTPHDRLVWDVGHQCYVHKMLTGRREQLPSIRTRGGISGFLRRDESKFDAFGAGHAGTSISAAVGMSIATQHDPDPRYVVAIIGDGSLTAGMAFEALNHAGALKLKRLIVILNDNDMSISENVGAISWLFSKAITNRAATKARSGFKELHRRGYVPNLLYKAIDRAEEVTQSFIHGPSMLFEAFGFRYIGPVDGHDVGDLVASLRNAKEQDVPVLIHARTKKGKGYEPAEEDPIKWHGVTPFDREKAVFRAGGSKAPPSYTAVFADTLIQIAHSHPNLRAITAAMPGGTGLDKFQAAHPDKCFDVGICEQHAVTFAAGLACEGLKPVCAIYSTFLQRAYDQVLHDVCIQNLPMLFAIDRGGMVGNDGETHQGVFDIAYLRTVPNIVIMSPKDENEFRHMILTGVEHPGPIALRYPRGNGAGAALDTELRPLEIGKGEIVRRGSDVLIIAFGPVVQFALAAADELERLDQISVTVLNARFAKPLDEALILEETAAHALVCTVEDHALAGGFGSAVAELLVDHSSDAPAIVQSMIRFGAGDSFTPHGSQREQHELHRYDPASIAARIRSAFHRSNSREARAPLSVVRGRRS